MHPVNCIIQIMKLGKHFWWVYSFQMCNHSVLWLHYFWIVILFDILDNILLNRFFDTIVKEILWNTVPKEGFWLNSQTPKFMNPAWKRMLIIKRNKPRWHFQTKLLQVYKLLSTPLFINTTKLVLLSVLRNCGLLRNVSRLKFTCQQLNSPAIYYRMC